MRIAATLLCLTLATQPGAAQDPEPFRADAQVIACRAWGDQLRLTTRRLSDHGLLAASDGTAVVGLVDLLGERCSGHDPARISALYAILLDTLIDQRHQP